MTAETMRPRPTLSVVMTNYNHGHYLPGALEALVSQSRPAEEIIIIDDASTDDSRSVIASFAEKHPSIRAIFNEKNMGVIPNANRGIRLATGTYVFSAAADDFILPGFFEKLMTMAERFPGVGLLTCNPAFLCGEQLTTAPLPLGDAARYLDGRALVRAQRASLFQVAGHASILHRETAIGAGTPVT